MEWVSWEQRWEEADVRRRVLGPNKWDRRAEAGRARLPHHLRCDVSGGLRDLGHGPEDHGKTSEADWDAEEPAYREMYPRELLYSWAGDRALDEATTEILRPSAEALAAKEQERARVGMARTRATRRKLIGDLLDAGHTGPSIWAVIIASPQYAARKAQDPAWEVPAWVADEIKRQRP